MIDATQPLPDPTKPLSVDEPGKQVDNSSKPWLFQKGQSGNPHGRPPKGYSISEAVKKMLNERPDVKAAIVDKIGDAAKGGDIAAIKLLWQYMDGMPAQAIDLTSDGQQIKTPIHYIPEEVDEKP